MTATISELPVRDSLDRAALEHLATTLGVDHAQLTDAELRASIERAQHEQVDARCATYDDHCAVADDRVAIADRTALLHAAQHATAGAATRSLVAAAATRLEALLTVAESWRPLRVDRDSGTPQLWVSRDNGLIRIVRRHDLHTQAVQEALGDGDHRRSGTPLHRRATRRRRRWEPATHRP